MRGPQLNALFWRVVRWVPMPRIIGLMPAALGYKETREMRRAHRKLVRAIRRSMELADVRPAWLAYNEPAEALVEALPDERDAHSRAEVGYLVAKALIWYEAGRPDVYLEELLDALDYADGMGLRETAALLRMQLNFTSRDISYLLGDNVRGYELEMGDYFRDRTLYVYAIEAPGTFVIRQVIGPF